MESWTELAMASIAPAGSTGGGSSGMESDDHWRSFDNSVNAVSFGFVATAILISMFLVMAIFERLLRQTHSSESGRNRSDLEAQMRVHGKLDYPSPKMTVYARGVSVLMPGEEIPTYIAHPAPAPCPPEGVEPPRHHRTTFSHPSSSSSNPSIHNLPN
ncbi:OLC1v1024066C1 [Oldenlandia corymbosa var. corymbosa]|uniref:OLC1v1024066C1 n=1 Tax=Oldenlandia corymbosa var. corymbosa TaxID=529605 RepID=A0AAV1C268_OLDCO|nr:OLC1v1024066C1 [Oldenlandia corymbosa var. corymbosa]